MFNTGIFNNNNDTRMNVILGESVHPYLGKSTPYPINYKSAYQFVQNDIFSWNQNPIYTNAIHKALKLVSNTVMLSSSKIFTFYCVYNFRLYFAADV